MKEKILPFLEKSQLFLSGIVGSYLKQSKPFERKVVALQGKEKTVACLCLKFVETRAEYNRGSMIVPPSNAKELLFTGHFRKLLQQNYWTCKTCPVLLMDETNKIGALCSLQPLSY